MQILEVRDRRVARQLDSMPAKRAKAIPEAKIKRERIQCQVVHGMLLNIFS